MSKQWYVVHAYSGYEKKVALAIEERIAMHTLQEKFGDIMVPTEEVIEMKGGQKRTSAMFWLIWSLTMRRGIWLKKLQE